MACDLAAQDATLLQLKHRLMRGINTPCSVVRLAVPHDRRTHAQRHKAQGELKLHARPLRGVPPEHGCSCCTQSVCGTCKICTRF